MIATVLGKQYRKGKSSRTGRDYEFAVIQFAAPARGVEGQQAKEKIIDGSILAYDRIVVGARYNVDNDFDGNILSMEIIK